MMGSRVGFKRSLPPLHALTRLGPETLPLGWPGLRAQAGVLGNGPASLGHQESNATGGRTGGQARLRFVSEWHQG